MNQKLATTGNPYARSARNYDRNEVSAYTALTCPEPTKTQQHQAEAADINNIVRNFGVTGKLPLNVRQPLLVDFDAPLDYRMMVDLLRDARDQFMKLPAKVRSRFANDPGAFVDFCSDSGNLDELRKMGLAPIPEVKNVAAEGGGPGKGAGGEAGTPA